MEKRFFDVHDVSTIMGVSRTTAYTIIRKLNMELEERGYITISGKVPRKFFEERCYGFEAETA